MRLQVRRWKAPVFHKHLLQYVWPVVRLHEASQSWWVLVCPSAHCWDLPLPANALSQPSLGHSQCMEATPGKTVCLILKSRKTDSCSIQSQKPKSLRDISKVHAHRKGKPDNLWLEGQNYSKPNWSNQTQLKAIYGHLNGQWEPIVILYSGNRISWSCYAMPIA